MKIKIQELQGRALDYAVAKCEKLLDSLVITPDGLREAPAQFSEERVYSPSTDWNIAGPIIDENSISIIRLDDEYGTDSKGFCNNKRIPVWGASYGQYSQNHSYEGEHYPEGQYEFPQSDVITGPTPLVAAMRCYVADSLRGKRFKALQLVADEGIEIPDSLLNHGS